MSAAAAEVDAVRARVEGLVAEWGPARSDLRETARQVVIVGSSSRGGSSIFAEALRRSRRLVHFRAEVNPFFRLYGADAPDSDALPEEAPIPPGLGPMLAWDVGRPKWTLHGEAERFAFSCEIAVRLSLQWPALSFSASAVDRDVAAVLRDLEREEGWPPGAFVDAQTFHARLLARLRVHWPEIHPAAYDLDRRLVDAHCPGPWPDPFVPVAVIEEPPFVCIVPWAPADEDTLATHPLVVKTPSNAYRMGWLRRLFHRADVRLLHLTRNVAASVNGLVDGWRHVGFHSHEVGGLRIAGYSELAPAGDRWWKFDRPPGWEAWTSASLPEVCAMQWRSERPDHRPLPPRLRGRAGGAREAGARAGGAGALARCRRRRGAGRGAGRLAPAGHGHGAAAGAPVVRPDGHAGADRRRSGPPRAHGAARLCARP